MSGPQLRTCLGSQPRNGTVHLFGESTLSQLGELMLTHANASDFHWPRAVRVPSPQGAYPLPGLSFDTYHGASTLLERALPALRELAQRLNGSASPPPPPAAYVFLQGANDAARDTLANSTSRLASFLQQLRAGLDDGSIAAPARGVVWVTAPVRQYTAGTGPGQVVCRGGDANATFESADACVMAYSPALAPAAHGAPVWTVHHGGRAPKVFGTLSRRRAYNKAALRLFRTLFPGSHVIDFEALTAPLPSDYSHDGEHWVAVYDLWVQRRGRGAYEGRSMAAAELGNVLANILCEGAATPPLL